MRSFKHHVGYDRSLFGIDHYNFDKKIMIYETEVINKL